MNRADK